MRCDWVENHQVVINFRMVWNSDYCTSKAVSAASHLISSHLISAHQQFPRTSNISHLAPSPMTDSCCCWDFGQSVIIDAYQKFKSAPWAGHPPNDQCLYYYLKSCYMLQISPLSRVNLHREQSLSRYSWLHMMTSAGGMRLLHSLLINSRFMVVSQWRL